MNAVPVWKIPKWPFVAVYVLLLGFMGLVISKGPHPMPAAEIYLAIAGVAAGSILACLPFILDHQATGKMIEANAVMTVAEQLADVKKFAAQIAAATDQWALVQETTKGNTEKTVTAAKEIAARMAEEIRDFNEFQAKLNDTEKGAMRLEIEKSRRGEAEWLQVVARILDHVFTLHQAASRSGNNDLAEQIGSFQNACREAARRVGLILFTVAENEKFDGRMHRAHGVEKPAEDAVVAETLAPGMTFQGRLVRPALVRLQDAAAAGAPAAKPKPDEPGDLALKAE